MPKSIHFVREERIRFITLVETTNVLNHGCMVTPPINSLAKATRGTRGVRGVRGRRGSCGGSGEEVGGN